MAEAADRAAWSRTFAVIAQMLNENRSEKSKPINVMEFFPWEINDPQPKPRKLTSQERQRMRELLPKKG